jgi:Sap-like sulfolipid-1-addressing protein
MMRLIGLVVAIGLADSVNPATIGPALYLAAGEGGRGRFAEFTFAVFAVYMLGGIAIALGSSQLVRSAFPRPRRELAHILEIVAGAAMLGVAGFLWWRGERLSQRELPATNRDGRSSVILGATITAVELPTAFSYFAAIAALAGSGFGPARQLGLLVLFNVCFVLPLIGIVAGLAVGGDGLAAILSRTRDSLQARWPAVLAGLALVAGVFVVLLGVTGLAAHGDLSRFIRTRLFLQQFG